MFLGTRCSATRPSCESEAISQGSALDLRDREDKKERKKVAPGGIRTHTPSAKYRVLYFLSYRKEDKNTVVDGARRNHHNPHVCSQGSVVRARWGARLCIERMHRARGYRPPSPAYMAGPQLLSYGNGPGRWSWLCVPVGARAGRAVGRDWSADALGPSTSVTGRQSVSRRSAWLHGLEDRANPKSRAHKEPRGRSRCWLHQRYWGRTLWGSHLASARVQGPHQASPYTLSSASSHDATLPSSSSGLCDTRGAHAITRTSQSMTVHNMMY